MGTFMKGNGKMTKLMDLESTITQMGLAMRGTGVKISSMVTARRHGQMAHATRVNTKMAKKMASGNSTGLTIPPIKDNLLTTIYMVWVSTPGLTAANTMVTGLITRCTAVVCSPGPTAGATMETTMTIESRASVFSYGPTAADTREAGSMGSNMVLGYTILQREIQRRVNGARARG
jgi:hypothetical protein